MTQPSGVSSGYITDLIHFLNTTFLSFTNLPPVLARHVCMQVSRECLEFIRRVLLQVCKYIADRLHNMLLSPDFKIISKGALEQFSLDVVFYIVEQLFNNNI